MTEIDKCHIDLQASAMGLDCTGKLAVLAGRRFMRIIDLDQKSVVNLKRESNFKWDVSVVQWNNHLPNQFAIAANETGDIYTIQEGDWRLSSSLRGHNRAISDLDWSHFESNLLATCSVDTYIFLWDTREDTRKPCGSFSTVFGAAQVKWNKLNSNLLATVHEGNLRLWDKRNTSQAAVQYITAHTQKIHGLDWNPTDEFSLATSSQDGLVKFWDVRDNHKADKELRTKGPAWRACYAPFGDGIITATVPQLRDENTVVLWSRSTPHQPVHVFQGHRDVVLDFQWRHKQDDSSDHQLVTWSRDQHLIIWKIDTNIQRYCGVDVDTLVHNTLSESVPLSTNGTEEDTSVHGTPTRSDETPSEHSSSIDTEISTHSMSLQQEFIKITNSQISSNTKMPHVEKMDIGNRSCTLVSHNAAVKILVTFPSMYPNNTPPIFVYHESSVVDLEQKTRILKTLKDTCRQCVQQSRPCLEACLQQLSIPLQSMQSPSNSQTIVGSPSMYRHQYSPTQANYKYNSFSDKCIPFPRTCGARFCGVDKLVVFHRPGTFRKNSSQQVPTPKALSALGSLPLKKKPVNQDSVSLSSYYNLRENKRPKGFKSKRKGSDSSSKQFRHGSVVLHNVSGLLPIHRKLAETYILQTIDIPRMCSMNAQAAKEVGRDDLVQVWSLASLSTDSTLIPDENVDVGIPWGAHPFGRKLLSSLIEYYSSIHDVQTLAMICCTFGSRATPTNQVAQHRNKRRDFKRSTSSDDFILLSAGKYMVQSSYDPIFTSDWQPDGDYGSGWLPESPDDYKFNYKNFYEIETREHNEKSKLLDENKLRQYDEFKSVYAEILYRWNIMEARADVLNYLTHPPPASSGLEFVNFGITCQHCQKRVFSIQCDDCRWFSFSCAICHVAVKGSSNFCLTCGHGGHTSHMLEWFKEEAVCPTGCGCKCAYQNC
ncbi:GATOR2 complex protein WDR59-like [Antedon mediterranea]|uniref:GATOR2 complex protein WDR59-like n=1 Tax=Antedon mediterranea TaxID=105859 RepID=UPI003AF7136B